MGTNMKAEGGLCSLSGFLLRKRFQNLVWRSSLPDNVLTPQWSDYSVHPKDRKSGNVLYLACCILLRCYLLCSAYVCSLFSGNTSSFLISWPDKGGTVKLRRPDHLLLFILSLSFFLQCFPGRCHSWSAATEGRYLGTSWRCLAAQMR